jgi:hypothetical protein
MVPGILLIENRKEETRMDTKEPMVKRMAEPMARDLSPEA